MFDSQVSDSNTSAMTFTPLVAAAPSIPDGPQTFANITITDNVGVTADGFFNLTAMDGSGYNGALYADDFGAFIQYDSTVGSYTSYFEITVHTTGSFILQSAIIGDYLVNPDDPNSRHDFSNVYVVGYANGEVVAQTDPVSSINEYNTDYSIDYSPFAGVYIDSFRVYYSVTPGVDQENFNLAGFTVSGASYDPPVVSPVFSSATVDGGTLVMTYTAASALDAVNVPGTGSFAVTAGGSAVAVDAVAVDADAKTVTLTLHSAVANGQAVTVAYTDPSAGDDASAIQDADGNDAASLSAASVTNTTPDTTPPSVSGNLALPAGGHYHAGQMLAFTVTFSENVTVTGSDSTLGLTIGSTARSATFASKTANSITYAYTVQAGDLDADGVTVGGISLGGTTVRDSAGNDADLTLSGHVPSTAGILVDAIAPDAPSAPVLASGSDTGTSSSDHITNAATPTLSGTAEAGATVNLYDGATLVGTTTATGGNWSITPSAALAEGGHTLTAKAIDGAGNVSQSSDGLTLTIDTTAPTETFSNVGLSADTGLSGTDFLTNTSAQTITATLSGALSGGDVAYGSLDNGATWTDITSKVSGTTLSWDGVVLAGSSTIKLKVSDAAGNDGSVHSQAYTLDTTTPNAPSAPDLGAGSDSGSSSSDDITKVTTPTVTGTAEAGATVTLYDTDGTTVLGATTASGGTWSITTSTLSAGDHTLTAKAADAAGNVSAASSGLTIDVDTTAPTGTQLSATTVSSSAATGGATLATLSATDAHAVTYSLATGNGTNDADNGSFSISGASLDVGASSLAAGTYKIYVAATDAAGNVANQALTLTVVDAPGVSSIARAGGAAATTPAASTSVAYTVTFDQAVTGVDATDFSLSSTGTASGSIASVSGSGTTYTVTVDGLSGDGTLRLDLNSGGTSIANGSSVEVASGYTSGQTYVLDHTAPNAPSTPSMSAASDTGASNSDHVTKLTTPTFTGTAEAGSTVTLYDTDGTTALGATTATGGAWSITPSALAEGTHTLTAKAVDAAGNASAASTGLAVTIDTTAPIVAITSDASSLKAGETATITFTFGEDPGATFTSGDVVVSGGTLGAISGTGLTRTAVFTPTDGVNSGTASITVAAGAYADAAGNNGGAGTTPSLAYDTLAPSAPSAPALASSSDTGVSSTDHVTSAATPTFTGTAAAGAIVTLYDGATLVGTDAADGGGNWSITPSSALAEGAHTLTAKAADAAGNVSSASAGLAVAIDTTAPTLAISSDVSSLKAGETATITFTFSEDPGSSFSWDGSSGDLAVSGGALSALSGTGTTRTAIFTPDADTNGGSASITVAAGAYADTAGNDGGAGTTPSLGFDTLAPDAPSAPVLEAASDTGTSNSDHLTKLATPTLSGAAEAGATVNLYDGATLVGTGTADGSGHWSITASTLGGGAHTLAATATDAAGNVSAAGGELTVTIDTTAPAAPSAPDLAPASDTGASNTDNVTTDSRPTFTGTAEAHAVVNLYDTDGTTLLGSTTANGSGDWSITSSTLGAGGHTMTVKAIDAAGNLSAASSGLVVTIQAPTPPPPPPTQTTTVDGVQVQTGTVTNSDGTTSQVVTIPVVQPSRQEEVGDAQAADIPLASSSGVNILTAQVPTGYGLTVTGSSTPGTAGGSLTDLIREIQAHTEHGSSDQSLLTGGGSGFLGALLADTPLIVQTIVPTVAAGAGAPDAPLVISGAASSSGAPMTALVIDTHGLPAGAQLQLQNVEFAAVIGDAHVTGGDGSQNVWGDSGSQYIVLGADDDELHGGAGDDVIGSKTGDDKLYGDAGQDFVFGGEENDQVFGGADADRVQGNTGDDFVQGNDGADTALGGQGHDIVLGGKGDDLVFGDLGNDTLHGDLGADTLHGGEGNDIVLGGDGLDAADDLGDRLFGEAGDDSLGGERGADTLQGNAGQDTLQGGEGADLLHGGQGADRLFGDAGDDILVGDFGDDTLTGGAGADRFVFGAGDGADVITDFNFAEGDRLAFDADAPNQQWSVSAGDGGALVHLAGGSSVLLAGVDAGAVNQGWFV